MESKSSPVPAERRGIAQLDLPFWNIKFKVDEAEK